MSETKDLNQAPHEQIFLPNAGFWYYYPDTDLITISQNAREVVGLDIDTLPLRELKERVLKHDQEIVEQFESTLRRDKSHLGVEFRVTSSDGKVLWISCYGEFRKGDETSTPHFGGYFINITSKKHQELKLNVSNSNFEKIEEISRMGSFNWVLSQDYLLCSDNFFNLTKNKNSAPDNRLSKEDFFELISHESKYFVLDVMHEAAESNQRFEVSFRLATHPEVKLKLFGYPLQDEPERKFFGLIQDVSYGGEGRNSLIEGQDSERKRISLELHDSVGQKLIAVKYKLALLKMSKDLNELDYVNKAIDEIIDEVRAITHNLSSQIVSEVGLKEAINQILTETTSALKANKHFEYNVEAGIMGVDTEKMIYRIIQESLSNALKHSKANNLTVKLNVINHQVSITIADDGVGFDGDSNIKKGIGIQNIKERVTYLNGFFNLTSTKGKGTRIMIRIPLSKI